MLLAIAEAMIMPRVVAPAFESKRDFCICADIAEKPGIGDEFTEGRDEREWRRSTPRTPFCSR